MRALVLSALIAGLAGPALAQADPSWPRLRNEALQAQEDARRDALEYQREARAREQRARVEATRRAMQSGELAGAPGPLAPYRPSTIIPIEPTRPAASVPPSADQARIDALMAQALARSNARVRAVTPAGQR